MARRGENIYKRKDGRYEGRYIKYYNMSGRAVYGYIYSKSYTDIKAQLAKCKTGKSDSQPGVNTPLSAWLTVWLKSQGGLKPTTKTIYQSYIHNHINAGLGDIPLKKLNADMLQSFINGLQLSPSTVKGIFSIIRSALSFAEDKGFVSNVWSKVKLPKKQRSIVQVLTPAQQRQLETVLRDHADMGILICLYTGLRIGEVCALKWSDIRFETGQFTVNGTQARTEKGIEIILPKSKASRREIPIPPFLLEQLKRMPHSCAYVVSRNKKPFDVRTYRRLFKKRLEAAKLPDMKFHCLRHTFATRALEVGMDYKTLSEILGHSSVGITLDLYAHSLKEHKIRQMNKLDAIHRS